MMKKSAKVAVAFLSCFAAAAPIIRQAWEDEPPALASANRKHRSAAT